MTGQEVFKIWAPESSVWSRWASPILFSHITCGNEADPGVSGTGTPEWAKLAGGPGTAIIVDLPGGESIRNGLVLAMNGYRPVPMFNGSPAPLPNSLYSINAPASVVDETTLIREVCAATPILSHLEILAEAPPVFLLDAMRMRGYRAVTREMFDNRWIVFPQDFPSARFFVAQRIQRIVLVQEADGKPQGDVAQVLLRWQDAGMEIFLHTLAPDLPRKIFVAKQSFLRSILYRVRAFWGLRGNAFGSFGSYSIADWFSQG